MLARKRKAVEDHEVGEERKRRELALDDAPASDPISIEQPVPPAPDRETE